RRHLGDGDLHPAGHPLHVSLQPKMGLGRRPIRARPLRETKRRRRLMTLTNRQWVLKHRPEGAIDADSLELIETPVPALAEGQVLVRNLYLSVDPTNRIWMSDRDQYLPPVGLGDVMRGMTIGVVEASRSDRFAPGDLVSPGEGGWRLYTVSSERGCRKLHQIPGVPLTA